MRRQGSHIFYTIGSQMVKSALSASRLYPQEDSWCSFLLEAESTTRAIVRLEVLGQLEKKFNDLIGNQTLDAPACSIVPQLTVLPRASNAPPSVQRNHVLPHSKHNASPLKNQLITAVYGNSENHGKTKEIQSFLILSRFYRMT
jgi:hypothetical protein